MKILVCIASYGSRNDQYLHQLLDEYARMPYVVDVVVVSNIRKELPAGVELRVGLPTKDPWSLPFAHRPLFIERRHDYELFIYSEDDTLITPRHIEAFLDATKVLEENEIAGFLRSEEGPDGTQYYSTIHRHYHWDSKSVVHRGEDVFAFFTNEHGACYVLTKDQLGRAIDSGGFSVVPHSGVYDMLVSAATDVYTQCGFRKLICLSRLEDFTCRHLTNKYVGRTGLDRALVAKQVEVLLEIGRNAQPVSEPTRVTTRLPSPRWAKSYYETRRDELLKLIPRNARRVLSIGCGWGNTEEALTHCGVEVTAVPLDVVIGALPRAKGIRTISASLVDAPAHLAAGEFDAILVSDLLHLVEDPASLIRSYAHALKQEGVLVGSVPNTSHIAVRLRRAAGAREFESLDDFRESGVHATSPARVRAWLRGAGFAVTEVDATVNQRWDVFDRLTLRACKGLWADQFAFAARKAT